MTDLEPRVREVVALHLEVAPEGLTPETTLSYDLCVDSLMAVELAMVLEDEFDIALPEEVLAGVRTFEDVVTVVNERVSRSGRPPAGADPS